MMDGYAREGVREYWVIDSEARTLEVYRNIDRRWQSAARGDARAHITSPTLPDQRFEVSHLFAN